MCQKDFPFLIDCFVPFIESQLIPIASLLCACKSDYLTYIGWGFYKLLLMEETTHLPRVFWLLFSFFSSQQRKLDARIGASVFPL